ncbi:hypothetical protein AAY473_003623 [Plecturocebus cupreus]
MLDLSQPPIRDPWDSVNAVLAYLLVSAVNHIPIFSKGAGQGKLEEEKASPDGVLCSEFLTDIMMESHSVARLKCSDMISAHRSLSLGLQAPATTPS